PGALNIPLTQLKRRLGELPREQRIITYCNMRHPGHSRGEQAAALLAEQGLQASALTGGYPAWQRAQDTLTTGEQ
ncbi:MAG TPA: rhodanese-like domain-containing protein, partial [Ktedonobacterales bacterium]|nr:rhodanese-like domain-containing protein [Ktedonobacterales bacterium]